MKEAKRLVARMPFCYFDDLRALRGQFNSSKIFNHDGGYLTQEQLTTFCIKYTYETLASVKRNELKLAVNDLIEEMLNEYELTELGKA